MKTTDIYENIADYKSKTRAEDRYTSFDYCYNYFRTVQGNSLTDDIEKSCLTLGFYLASWGMFRGSSFLIDKSAKHFEPTVRYVAKLDRSIWLIDVDSYEQNNIMTIIQIYNDIKNLIITGNNSDLTLITKIMLGVFGFIPAFDKYF
ncbi:MAG: hypothetical protein Q8S01_02225, partial [Ignavibacteria bacterium]|nr:hypothetical protein [Ignavibacteria bacterium]